MLRIFNKSNINELTTALSRRADDISPEITATVLDVLSDVKAHGDEALRRYSERFDKVKLGELYMTRAERAAALEAVEPELRKTMEAAAVNIRAFHEKQKNQSWVDAQPGKIMGQRVLPLRSVGLYIPGGTAAYPSSVLMNAIPAKVAGVKKIVMATPPKDGGINPAVVCAAEIAGVDEILTVGGAQAIAAFAYGTESVERADKIVGPGNIYVATAKRMVYGAVDIDMIAGPSEVLVIADETAEPRFAAADLLSQAEHDPLAALILITTSTDMAERICNEVEKQLRLLPRREIAGKAVENYGFAAVVDSLDEAAALSDRIAPEHLELMVAQPFELLGKVSNAGSVFLGRYSPEPLGDYFAGPNHVLPTNGTARFSSALSVDSFMKKSSYLYYGQDELSAVGEDIIRFAEAEGFTAHANSIRVRMQET